MDNNNRLVAAMLTGMFLLFPVMALAENGSADLIYRDGIQKYLHKNYRGAASDFQKVYTLNNKHSSSKQMLHKSLVHLGDMEYDKDNLEKAGELYSRALELADDDHYLREKLETIADINSHVQREKLKNHEDMRSLLMIAVIIAGAMLLMFTAAVILYKTRAKKIHITEDMIIQVPGYNDSRFIGEERYSEIVRAVRLWELTSELSKGTISWDDIQDYIGDLNKGLKEKILATVYHTIDRNSHGSLDSAVKIVLPLASDDDPEIRCRSREMVRLLTGNDGDNSKDIDFMLQLARMVDAKTGRYNHSLRIAECAYRIAARLDDPEAPPFLVKKVGLLHDVGFLQINGLVATEEKDCLARNARHDEIGAIIEKHTTRGVNLIRYTELPGVFAEGIRHHHERLDGSGYPSGIKGGAIPLIAQIIGAAEFFDERYVRNGDVTAKDLKMAAGTWYRKDIVDILFDLSRVLMEGEFSLLIEENPLNNKNLDGPVLEHRNIQ